MTSFGSAESLSLSLREIYQSYGYRQYKVGKFEEYDLYARFRNFLSEEHILTFSDLNGHLMALKPDITLSIVKNTRDDDRIRKVWYTETVYRVPRNSNTFHEILQTGLECIGAVDLYTMAEVLMLAAHSLETISPSYVLDISHIGILSGLFSAYDIPAPAAKRVLDAFGEKNLPMLRALTAEFCQDPEAADLFQTLCLMEGDADSVISQLQLLPLPDACQSAVDELHKILEIVNIYGQYNINMDLSVTDDTEYYNGLIFRGFIDGVSGTVLSGGRYDDLLHHMGKPGGAIGFAIYMSELERLLSDVAGQDFDVLLTYRAGTDPAVVAGKVRELVQQGLSVRAQQAGDSAVTFKKRIELENGDTAI